MINPKEIIEDYKKYYNYDLSIKDICKKTKFSNGKFVIGKNSFGFFIKENSTGYYYNFLIKRFEHWLGKPSNFYTHNIMDCLETMYDK